MKTITRAKDLMDFDGLRRMAENGFDVRPETVLLLIEMKKRTNEEGS